MKDTDLLLLTPLVDANKDIYSPLLLSVILEFLTSVIKQEREIENTGKEKIKLSLFTDDMQKKFKSTGTYKKVPRIGLWWSSTTTDVINSLNKKKESKQKNQKSP